MPKVTKWLSRIASAMITVVFLITLTFTISSKISGGPPKIFGFEMMNVLSGSMEPNIHTGSVIFIKKAATDGLKIGDIISFRTVDHSNIIITHRVVEVQKTSDDLRYITKGDANDAKDSTAVPAANVVGEYSGFTIPFLGYIFSFVKSRAGIIAFMLIPGALLIIWQLFTIWRLIAKMDASKDQPMPAEDIGQA